ncbi:MAG: RelA/SpoT family protein [Hyphomicrobiaceae bacterium]
MMRQYELVERVLAYDPGADEAMLNRAYVYAMKAHSDQKRASGDPYFSHPLEVAAILTDLKLDDATITTALLHDVIEDTDATRAEIDRLFGPEIGALVDGLTKIKRLDLVTKKAAQAENFRKLLIAISSDIRVLLVKLADRLHNMRTLEHVKPQARIRISQETLDIYAPLAGRMGMRSVVEELQDWAFHWLHPVAYATVKERLAALHERNSGIISEIRSALANELQEVGIVGRIDGRRKTPFAVWQKMENRQISLEQLSDIYGFRVIVENVPDCYRAVGVAHTKWRAVPGRFKDYISTPKQNGYRSLHTTIVGPRHQRVELQIRTENMHDVAEYGVAAHANYKTSEGAERAIGAVDKDSGPYGWLRRLVEALLEGNPEEFLEHTKLELFLDQVFCFTPKGRLIALPRGATPIDFAYAVHTDIGNSAIGAIVNGRPLPLSATLGNGDEVQIQCDESHIPPAAWERIATTGRARAAIRRATREALRQQYVELGRRLLESACERHGADYSDARLKMALDRFSARSVEDVLVSIGRGELDVKDAVRGIAPDTKQKENTPSYRPRNRHDHGRDQDGWFNLSRVMNLKFYVPGKQPASARNGMVQSVPIRGFKGDLPVTFQEGGAVPGDRIVGVLVPNEGIKIFQIHSPKLREYESANWVDVTWDINPDHPERFPSRLSVTAVNEPGTLAQIAQVIGESDGNIDNLRMVRRASDFTEMLIEVDVWDLEHLNRLISGLNSKTVVSKVERVFE